FHFAAITGIGQVRQRQRNWPDILAVEINFRWRIDSRVGDFESQQGRQRLRFNWELEHAAFLGLSINPDRISRESCSDGSKVFNVFRGRVQRGHRGKRLRNYVTMFRAHRMHHLTARHPTKIRATDRFSLPVDLAQYRRVDSSWIDTQNV